MREITKIILLGTMAVGICFAARAYADAPKTETIVLAGGCFWGVEAVFEHTKGVTSATSGYAGGNAETARYDQITSGRTGHAESVKVTYNPLEISLSQLLDIYFGVAHNPTQLNYQGPDHGTQYRSAVFYSDVSQQKMVEQKISELEAKNAFDDPIVTTLEKLEKFYPAEYYHQDYAAQHPMNPYIIVHDAPKVTKLKSIFPNFYKE